jgi:hypothetical protein
MSLPVLARWLGYSGLIPFVAIAAGLWLGPLEWRAALHSAMLGYGAVILSFMGAVHWGLAMAGEGQGQGEQRRLALSVLPALLGWLALLLPVSFGYSVLLLGFAGLCLIDQLAGRRGLLPSWYPPMRVSLTAGVVLSLLLGGLTLAA